MFYGLYKTILKSPFTFVRFDIFGINVAEKPKDLTKQQSILAEKLITETLFEEQMEIWIRPTEYWIQEISVLVKTPLAYVLIIWFNL